MIAVDKVEKLTHLKFLISQLWQGQVTVAGLSQDSGERNPEKWSELIGYLEKHQSEIIKYNRRRLVGKTIGSGRMEKWNQPLDVVRRRKL